MKKIKVGVAGIYHETNTFAPGLTELADFQAEWITGTNAFLQKYRGTRTPMGGAIDGAEGRGAELVGGFFARAVPSGVVAREAIETLLQVLTDSLARSVDGLLLILHGAMVSENYPDVEAEIVSRFRAKFGRTLPIVVTVDMHANMSAKMADDCTCIVGYDTYPHVDTYERAIEAMELLVATIAGAVKPVMSWQAAGMLVVPQKMYTSQPPMKTLLDYAIALEQNPSILNVTVLGGFPYSDVADAGMSFLVTTNNDRQLAEDSVASLCELAWSLREQFVFKACSIEEAIAWTANRQEGPVVWIEGSDNVGAGAPADATHVLERLIRLDVKGLIVMKDAEAALMAHRLGVGETIDCLLGGKTDKLHGRPTPIKGYIRLLSDGKYKHAGDFMTGKQAEMGKTAVIEMGHTTIIVTEKRVQPYDIEHVRIIGVLPQNYKIIVVKSAVAWRSAFGRIAKHAIDLDTPGCCSANLRHFTYKNVRHPIFPLNEGEKEEERI